MEKAIYFDMDGTIANLYAVENQLEKLRKYDDSPYRNAKIMVNMSQLARLLNKLQKKGFHIGVISWLSKCPQPAYDLFVTNAKYEWLRKHLKSVRFDEVKIVAHGTPKGSVVKYPQGILFDDEEQNRLEWAGQAYDEKNILEILKKLIKNT